MKTLQKTDGVGKTLTIPHAKARTFLAEYKKPCYRSYSASAGRVERSFNHGMGSLGCFRFTESNAVHVNDAIAKPADMKRIEEFFSNYGLGNPDFIHDTIGYPEYYSRSI